MQKLSPDTPVTVKAYHKETGEETTTRMSYKDWMALKKNENYFYKCLQVV